jgi:hypothetical protein
MKVEVLEYPEKEHVSYEMKVAGAGSLFRNERNSP